MSKLDDILGSIAQAEGVSESDKADIKALMLDIIGEDEGVHEHVHAGSRNSLRSKLRKGVNEL
jgi:hypothetical protein